MDHPLLKCIFLSDVVVYILLDISLMEQKNHIMVL